MTAPDPAAMQKAATAAAIEQQMAAQAALAQRKAGLAGHPHKHSPYNLWILIAVMIAAIASFAGLILKGG